MGEPVGLTSALTSGIHIFLPIVFMPWQLTPPLRRRSMSEPPEAAALTPLSVGFSRAPMEEPVGLRSTPASRTQLYMPWRLIPSFLPRFMPEPIGAFSRAPMEVQVG